MVELADTRDLGSRAFGCGGSTPSSRTNEIKETNMKNLIKSEPGQVSIILFATAVLFLAIALFAHSCFTYRDCLHACSSMSADQQKMKCIDGCG